MEHSDIMRLVADLPIDDVLEATGDTNGFCLGCKQQQSGVEPDAEGYECESCGEKMVFGAEQIILYVKW